MMKLLESITDSESNLNSGNQPEANVSNNSLKITIGTSENEAKESEREKPEGQ